MSRIVGARSTSITGSRDRRPAGIPGPRISSGRCVDGSYATVLPLLMRCWPSMNPLSDVKITYVPRSWPVSRSVLMIVPTARSIPSSASWRSR